MSSLPAPDLRGLPKAHLHVHLEGAMRRSTLSDLARHYDARLPSPPTTFGSFADFGALYFAAAGLLRSLDDLARLVGEVVEDAASAGAVWIEPAVHLPDHTRLGEPQTVLDTLLDAGSVAEEATGVGVGWLITADRTLDPTLAVTQAEIAVRNAGRGVVAFGLANDESASPPELFADAFAIANAGGLIAAPHAGEHRGPEAVRSALDVLGADRIQHGVRAIEDDELVGRLAGQSVCLDVCPTSNVALSVVPDLAHHPLPMLLERGVACTINADDPLLFGVDLLHEYEVARDVLHLGSADLARCARTSIDHSGAPAAIKSKTGGSIDAWLATAHTTVP
jgi:adenosine deaminase